MTNQMLREAHELLHDVAGDETLTVIVLTGAGKAFCPGADLKHYTSGEQGEAGKDEHFDVPVEHSTFQLEPASHRRHEHAVHA